MKKTLEILILIAVTGCGSLYEDIPTQPKVYAIDGVKLVSKDIDKGGDERSYDQEYFRLGESQRLLLKLETLEQKADSAHITEDHRMILEITLHADEVLDEHLDSIRACPLLRNWMMLATWRFAHPYSKSGAWRELGGDYDAVSCIQATNPAISKGVVKTNFARLRWSERLRFARRVVKRKLFKD